MKRKMGKFLGLVMFGAVVGAVVFFFIRDDVGPQIDLNPDSGFVSSGEITLDLTDKPSGLNNVRVVAQQQGQEIEIFRRSYAGQPLKAQETLSLAESGLREGAFTLKVEATDMGTLGGNSSEAAFSLTFDNTPPRMTVLSKAHNIRRGGVALVVYTVSEEVVQTGVIVGERFFPAYRQPSGKYASLFAWPHDVSGEDFKPRVVAEDQAGNKSTYGFRHYANNKRFPSDKIRISDGFLGSKMPQFSYLFPEAQTDLEVFLAVNRELRKKNRAALHEFGLNTSEAPLWDGAFLRQPGANRAHFGDQRHYIYNGKQIDRQTHLGVDIASTEQAPIKAANNGRVVFADFMGIYGKCVIVDHGLGLQSLYGHLSSIDVQVGDVLDKGQVLGRSGATGMAGGDHLHLGMLVSGIPVEPREWWDGNWIKNNVTAKLEVE